jgi:formamidopyrimidine-DNA glycosylase
VPELPEVETFVRDLQQHLIGRRIASVEVGPHPLRRRWQAEWGKDLTGRRVREVRRRGKWIVMALDGGPCLVFHLGMTGDLRVAPAGLPRQPHTHLVMRLDRGAHEVRFRDVRRFGSASLFRSVNEAESFFVDARLGPEPFAVDRNAWRERLAGMDRPLKVALLDQRVVAGVGNIYADESLFAAGLHPTRLASQVSAVEAERLRGAIVEVLTRAIERRGSSVRDYAGGSFQEEHAVYKRAGQPCPRCGALIDVMRLAGRSTHFCPKCQRSPRSRLKRSTAG